MLPAPKTILHIGLGGAGQRHLRLIRQLLGKDLRHLAWRQTRTTPNLTASFQVDASVSIEENYGLEIMPDLQAAIAEKPDLAVIATPTSLHMAPAQALATAGVPMVIEKPLSHNMDGVPAFVSDIQDSGLSFAMVFQRRRHPLIARAQALIADGRLGAIVSAAFDVSSFVPM
jgi:predicted dehydrogenase